MKTLQLSLNVIHMGRERKCFLKFDVGGIWNWQEYSGTFKHASQKEMSGLMQSKSISQLDDCFDKFREFSSMKIDILDLKFSEYNFRTGRDILSSVQLSYRIFENFRLTTRRPILRSRTLSLTRASIHWIIRHRFTRNRLLVR